VEVVRSLEALDSHLQSLQHTLLELTGRSYTRLYVLEWLEQA
jgi:hypothetical protein